MAALREKLVEAVRQLTGPAGQFTSPAGTSETRPKKASIGGCR